MKNILNNNRIKLHNRAISSRQNKDWVQAQMVAHHITYLKNISTSRFFNTSMLFTEL